MKGDDHMSPAPAVPPLGHLTVLDLSRVRAGPTAVRQLADRGANVVKIEEPAKDDGNQGLGGSRDGPDFQNLHRNKRSITLNLKPREGVALFYEMAKRADVGRRELPPGR
jgi:crotonobetainyl-CoA:carnitine CoA-transferase CaiB-like acyl-CoA transferase